MTAFIHDGSWFDVSPSLVHRIDHRDVFVSTVRMVGQHRHEVSARWPASHPFYGPVAGRHDPLLLLETVREAGLAVMHGSYGIPRDTAIIVRGKEFEINPAHLRTVGDEPVVVDLTATAIERRGRSVTGMSFDIMTHRGGTVAGIASYQVRFASVGVYNRLRGPYRDAKPALSCDTAPVSPEMVGRAEDTDVLLSDAPGTRGWYLRIDPAHPVLFDHAMDHLPGNAIIEVARQAAYLATGRPDAILVRGRMAFLRYIEFDTPCVVRAEQAGDRGAVAVTFTQGSHVAAQGELLLET